MIYVVTEDEATPGARARNAHIQAQAAAAAATGHYGALITDHQGLRQALEGRDRRLFLFAHGNAQVVGRFGDMNALVAHLRDHLRPFNAFNGRTINEIFVNSCESEGHAGAIAAAVRAEFPGRFMTIIGTRGRSFTDTQGNVRVARTNEEADELDASTRLNPERFQQMIDRNCLAVGEGLAVWQV